MKITIVHRHFWPNTGGQFIADLCEALVARGHQVTVICSRTQYGASLDTPCPKVKTIRIRPLPWLRGTYGLMAGHCWFLFAAAAAGVLAPRCDVIITLTNPPLSYGVGYLVSLFRGSRHYIWEMDLYPDVASDVGLLARQSPLVRITGGLADYIRRRAESVIVLGECMRARLIARGLPMDKMQIAENWADDSIYKYLPAKPDRQLTLVYPGNMGRAHEFDTILDAMAALQGDDRVHLHFIGGGPQRRAAEELVRKRQLGSVRFMDYRPPRALGSSRFDGADIGVVTLKASCVGSVVPSKIYPLMAVGLPFIFIGPRDATPSHVIERFGCGWQVDIGDCGALAALLVELAANRQRVAEAGKRAYEAYTRHYRRDAGVDRICRILGVDPVPSLEHTSVAS